MEVEDEDSRLLTDEDKWCIVIGIKYFNIKYREIQSKFNINSLGTISKVWNKYLLFNHVENNYGDCGGHNSKMYDEEVKELIKSLNLIKYSTADIQHELKKNHRLDLSRAALNETFKKLNMKYGRISEIHQLTEKNKLERFDFCTKHQNDSLKNVIFSDESIFQICESNNSVWFFKDGEIPHIATKSLSYTNRSIHIWGAISYNSKSPLFIHSKQVDNLQYQNCLDTAFLPWVKDSFKRKQSVLLQDGAKSHTSKSTEAYFTKNSIKIRQNPPWSPDLNSIELVWACMKKQFMKTRLNTKIET